MNQDLSIFADRLRDFITICSDETDSFSPLPDSDLARHFDTEFNAMALVLFALQFANNPVYRRICESRNVRPNAIAHWTEIPTVPTPAFKDLELTSLSPEDRTTQFHSSGTTQQRPSRHFHSPESLALYEHSLWTSFKAHVLAQIPGGPRPVILAPSQDQAPHSSLVHMFDVIRRKVRAPANSFFSRVDANGAWVLNAPAALDQLREASRRDEPVLVLGTAFSLVHLLDDMAEHGLAFALPRASRVMETGGYKGLAREVSKPELHALITARLGVAPANIIAEYGMSELSSQAYQFGRSDEDLSKPRFRFPPWARVQITSPETAREARIGEVGLIRVFDLANVFSVVAIETEDLAIRHTDGFELVGRRPDVEPRGCSLMNQPHH